MNKKSILLVMTSLSTGGIATAIRNMMEELASDSYEIDLLLFDPARAQDIASQVTLLDAGKYMRLVAINQKQAWAENKILGLVRFMLGGMCKLISQRYAYAVLLSLTKSLPKHYDVAISCSQSAPVHRLYGGCNEFVLKKVSADLKIAFIHCDYELYGLNSAYSHHIYEQFDKIATVSRSVREGFLRCEPDMAAKMFVAVNFHNYRAIWQQAQQNPVYFDKGLFHLITVARFGREKGHARMLPILHRLKKEGYRFQWHLVGVSPNQAEGSFLQTVQTLNLQDEICFEGDQSNPYRYMKGADLLLIPSYHEAAPMIYEEAHCLGLPILTTKTLSAEELVAQRHLGLVCANKDHALERALRKILQQPEQLTCFRKGSRANCSNQEAWEQFNALVQPIGDNK